MARSTKHFIEQVAPCGQEVEADRLQDRDEDCLLTDTVVYGCGCRDVRHEYHDGSVSRSVTHHDGKTLVHELIAER